MTPEQADRAAAAIAETWPAAKISPSRWVESLTRLDYDQALATYRDLRDTRTDPPTIALFLARNRELHTRRAEHFRDPCAICDGTGWQRRTVTRPDYARLVAHEITDPDTGETRTEKFVELIPYEAVQPCDCSNGRQYDAGFTRAVEANEIERRRTAPASAYLTPPRPPVQQAADF